MRRRLLLSTLGAVAAALFLLGVPLSVAIESVQQQIVLDALESQAQQAVAFVNQEAGSPQQAAAILEEVTAPGTKVTVLTPTGQVLYDTPPDALAPGTTVRPTPDLRQLSDSRVGMYRGHGRLAVALPTTLVGQSLVLRLEESDALLRLRVRQAWLAIGGLVLAALGGAACLAVWQGRRLAAPLEDLAGAARRMGEGDFTARAPRSGLPEADEVALALDATAARLGSMLERSRSFGSDASHQLRTPLTALRLDLEALELSGADAQLVSAATAEADRLEATIDELLTLSEPPSDAEPIDVGQLAAARLDAWQSLARAHGREVVLDAGPVAPVRMRAAALGQALQVLLDNALEHGDGTITVEVRHIPGPGVRLMVRDDGPGFPAGDPPRAADRQGTRHGRGLPLARSLVEAEGGRLQVERPERGAEVCLLLPATAE